MATPIDGLLEQLTSRMGGLASLGGASPFGADPRMAVNPFIGGVGKLANAAPQFQGLAQQGSPFGGKGFNVASPFQGKGFQVSSPFQGALRGGNPFGGRNPLAALTGFNPWSRQPESQPGSTTKGNPNNPYAPTSGTSSGMSPGVAQWAEKARATFGDFLDPDIMLAIMENESGGANVQNSEGYPAYGLFQLWNQPGLSIDQQFAAARTLAQEKLSGIAEAYARNGLNPDARTRARDFALAWAGHFDYKTGLPNPNSADIGSAKQTAQQYGDIFLSHYDKIKGGYAPTTGTSPGVPGSMRSIWGGGEATIGQGFGPTDYSEANPSVYTYAAQYGARGHTGLDINLKRGTQLYSPGDGVVLERVGGYFRDGDYGDDGHSYERGELRIKLDNGDIVILGHMSRINVRPGQRITAGMLVGLSGSSDGDHLHIEWRTPTPGKTPSGWTIVDPRTKMQW